MKIDDTTGINNIIINGKSYIYIYIYIYIYNAILNFS